MTDKKTPVVNFFKPASPHAKANTILVLTCVIVWAVAVFGFQLALVWTGKMTPEDTYTSFEKVWEKVKTGKDIPREVNQEFARDLLMVLGKNVGLKDKHKSVLKNRLSITLLDLFEQKDKEAIYALHKLEEDMYVEAFKLEELKEADTIVAKEMTEKLEKKLDIVRLERKRLAPIAADAIGLISMSYEDFIKKDPGQPKLIGLLGETYGDLLKNDPVAAEAIARRQVGFDNIMCDLLPFSIVGVREGELTEENKSKHEGLIKLYFVHDSSGEIALLGIDKKKAEDCNITVGQDFSMLYTVNIKTPHQLKIGTTIEAMTDSAKCDDPITDIMKLYLHHLEGPLTSARFMGFPFHYWYTAQFLLILFVLICLVYGFIIDKINRKYQFQED